jgi:hypothetical protein
VPQGRLYTITVNNEEEAEAEQTFSGFIRWLTDWVEVEA